MNQPNIELVPRAVHSITPHGVVDADGVEHRADVLVLSTGFQPTNYLAHLDVVAARESRSTSTGTANHALPRRHRADLPNFYMLYGPGTNGGEFALNLRNRAAYARRAISE